MRKPFLHWTTFEKDDHKSAVIRHDARALPIANITVDLIVTSPPYWNHRYYQDESGKLEEQIGDEENSTAYLAALTECMNEWKRILKPTGSIWIVLGDKYAGTGGSNQSGLTTTKQSELKFDAPKRYKPPEDGIKHRSLMGLPWRFANQQVDNGWLLRAEVIWAKRNPLPDPNKDRVWRAHEHIFHFTKQDSYYYDLQDRMVLKSVWPLVTEPLTLTDEQRAHYELPDHFAAFPSEIPRRIIPRWSPPGGVVLDPFGGSGTTAGVARVLGRYGISNDLSPAYNRLAEWRIWKSGHFKNVEDRSWADQQEGLFENEDARY